MGQTSVLFHLHHGSSCGVSDIGELLGVTNPAASQMVHRMVILGLIERTEDPDDRRAKQLQLTANGRLIVKESIEARRRWMEQLTYTLTSEEQTLIINALNILVDAARDLEPRVNKVESREQNEPGKEHIAIEN
jgi:DNA-binding MarR family transcriptional regulator